MNNMPDAPRTYHVPRGGGEAVVKALATRAKARGVDIRLAEPATGLVKTGGAVSAALLERDGEDVEVVAPAVVVASGGYAANKEWVKKYGGLDLGVNVIPVGNVGKMGDGIRMAWEAGADECGIEVLELFRVGPIGPGHLQQSPVEYAGVQPGLWVDTEGVRFCDETDRLLRDLRGQRERAHQAVVQLHGVRQFRRQRLATRGIDKAHGTGLLPGARSAGLAADLERLVGEADPEVFAAGTVLELAENMGVPSENLERTVAEYNRFSAQRHDDLFAKDPAFLHALVGPRFYAIRARTVCLGTMGGIQYQRSLPGPRHEREAHTRALRRGIRRRRHVWRQLSDQALFGPEFGLRDQLRPHRRTRTRHDKGETQMSGQTGRAMVNFGVGIPMGDCVSTRCRTPSRAR